MDALALADGENEAEGLTLGDGDWLALGLRLGEIEALGLKVADGERLALGEIEGL